MKKYLITFILVIFWVANISAVNKVRIMTYNLENYGGDGYDRKSETQRDPYYRTIIDETDPDIIVFQEVYGRFDGETRFLDNVLNHEDNIYAVSFIDQKTDDNRTDVWQDIGVYYKNQMFQPIAIKEVEIAGGYLRDAIEVKLKYMMTKDTITIYGIHLKAGQSDAAKREEQAKKLRNYLNDLPGNSPFILAGDFNIYTSSDHLPVFADFDFTGIVSVEKAFQAARKFQLHQNFPNPFNPQTSIEFTLPEKCFIKLNIYNIKGEISQNPGTGYFSEWTLFAELGWS